VLYPGEIEHRREQERLKNGVDVDDKTWQAMTELASRFGVSLPG
jgi:LDH2 family malate/lactate/ureidoglycolate dehydrogenase